MRRMESGVCDMITQGCGGEASTGGMVGGGV